MKVAINWILVLTAIFGTSILSGEFILSYIEIENDSLLFIVRFMWGFIVGMIGMSIALHKVNLGFNGFMLK